MHPHLKPTLALPLVLLLSSPAQAQTEAVTAAGDTVLLYSDGTWTYANPDQTAAAEFPPIDSLKTNPVALGKPQVSQNSVKSETGAYEVWYNTKKWQRTPPGKINAEADMAFVLNKSEGYGVVIFERLEIPLDKLREIAVMNARNAANNVKVVGQEMRKVNGKTLLCLEMAGDLDGLKFTYLSYYYSGKQGSLQFITFTTQNMFATLKPDFEELLNGLMILEN
jgi:hypothetical protein